MTSEVIVAIVVAVFASTGFWTFINTIYTNRTNKKSVERKALLGLLHERLIEKCEEYIKAGKITLQEYEDLRKYIYDPYRDLGGNGTGEDWFSKVKTLPNGN